MLTTFQRAHGPPCKDDQTFLAVRGEEGRQKQDVELEYLF